MRLYWRGSKIVDITRDFLDTNGAPQAVEALVQSASAFEQTEFSGESLQKTIDAILSDLNCCSQKALGERFDSTIGAATVLMPYGGKCAATPPRRPMAARVPSPEGETDTSTLMAFGFDPYLSERDPFTGSVYAIVTSVAKLVAAGADMDKTWLTLQEYFPRLGTDATRWGPAAFRASRRHTMRRRTSASRPSAARIPCPARLWSWMCPPRWSRSRRRPRMR